MQIFNNNIYQLFHDIHKFFFLFNNFLIKGFEEVTRIRGTQLVSNNKEHTPFAFLEKQGQPDEAYRCIDCILVVKNNNICKNCEKLQKTMQQIH